MGSQGAAAGVPEQGCAPRGRRFGTRPKFSEFAASPPARGRGRGGLGGARARGTARLEPGPAARRSLPSAGSAEPAPSRAFPRRGRHIPSATPSRRGRRTQAPTRRRPKFQPLEQFATGAPGAAAPAPLLERAPGRRRQRRAPRSGHVHNFAPPRAAAAPEAARDPGASDARAGRGMPGKRVRSLQPASISPELGEAAAVPRSAGSGAAAPEGAGLPLRSPVPGPAAPLATQAPPPQLQTGGRGSGSHCDSAAAPPPAGHALRPRPHARPAPRLPSRRGAAVRPMGSLAGRGGRAVARATPPRLPAPALRSPILLAPMVQLRAVGRAG